MGSEELVILVLAQCNAIPEQCLLDSIASSSVMRVVLMRKSSNQQCCAECLYNTCGVLAEQTG